MCKGLCDGKDRIMKIKKWLALGLATIAVVAFTAGCGSSADKAAGGELPKKMVIGLDDNFPPMGFRDDKGEIVGFDIDLAKEAAKRAGMEVEFKAIDWDSKEAELKSKRIDALWNGVTVTPDREKNVLFSTPYVQDKQIIVVRNDSTIQGKADLTGKIVGTQQGSNVEPILEQDAKERGIKEVKKYGDFVNAFMDLELGRIDALVVDGIVGQYTMTQKPGKFRVANDDYGADKMAVGFRLEDKALQEKINGVLKEMMNDGTADKIAEKWFGNSNLLNKDGFK